MRLYLSLILSTMAALPAIAQEQQCQFRDMGRAEITRNKDGAWQVLASKSGCQATFGGGGRTNFQMTSVTVVQRPSNGSVSTNSNGFSYKPKAGVSSDVFVIKLCGKSTIEQGCANVTYNVVVQ